MPRMMSRKKPSPALFTILLAMNPEISPESAIGIAKDRNTSSCGLGLARRAKGLDQEPRQVSPRANPQPRDGHEGHGLMTSYLAAPPPARCRAIAKAGGN